MKKIFAEIGFGNGTFFSTEIENGDTEHRIPKFIKPKKIEGYYFSIWLFRTVFILSTNCGLEMMRKNKNRIKILFGISGYG